MARAGLPDAISGRTPIGSAATASRPRRLIVLGFRRDAAERLFESCDLAGHVTNRYGVRNEESQDHPDIFVCRGPRQPWPDLWLELRRFG